MRAVHLLRKLNPAEWGGTETAIQRLFDGLRVHGVTPVVYCPRLEHHSSQDPLQQNGYCVNRFSAFVPILGLSRSRKREMVSVGGNLMSFDLISSLWREQEMSIIHTHALGRIGGIGLTIAKQRRIPFVVSVHGGVLDLPHNLKQQFNAPTNGVWEWGKLFGLLFQSHRLFRDADAILTCNSNEQSLLKERYPSKHIVVQQHGVPLQLFQSDQRPAARTAFPQICGKRVLLTAGRIDPVKNQSWLLTQLAGSLQRDSERLLVLAGAPTHEAYSREIQQQVHALGLANQVLLTGGLPPDDPRLIGLFQEAHAIILPSVSETFGLVILEAWAAGTIPIASRTTGALALIRPGSNGLLFDLEEPETLRCAIEQTLSNRPWAKEMAARGREQVEQDHTISTLGQRLKRLYEDLIEERACAT